MKVLVVEDSNLMVAVITNFVKKEMPETDVVSASNGAEGVEKYKKEKPDVVFMDIKMPLMDGFEALERIRAFDPKAKVVMCTALKEPEQEARAKTLGACGYITKPFGREEIRKALQTTVGLK